MTPPAIFDGQLAPLEFHLDEMERLEEHLLNLRSALNTYVDGLEPINPKDELLLETMDALRQAMEVVYQQRLTFKGERRPSSGPMVEGTMDVKTVAGNAKVIEARWIARGTARATLKADRVESGASVSVINTERIG